MNIYEISVVDESHELISVSLMAQFSACFTPKSIKLSSIQFPRNFHFLYDTRRIIKYSYSNDTWTNAT